MQEVENEKNWWQPSLTLFAKLSGWVVGPTILALFIGRWLDNKYQTEPWLLLTSVGVVSLISLFGIIKEAEKAMKGVEKGNKDKRRK